MATGSWILTRSALTALLLCNWVSSDKAGDYTFIDRAMSAPAISYYDYIIIGGGTAGCPLAATLSQNYTVLLVERGGSPYGNSNITDLIGFGAALSDLSPTSPSQRFISEDGVINARARVLGGGTCLNAGFYTRAADDYVREAGWDTRLVQSSYEWVEKVVAFEPPVRQWQSAVRDGLLEAGVLPYNSFTYNHRPGTKIGGTIFDSHGRRHTAADLLQYANPAKLTVLLHATVSKILFRNVGTSRPAAYGIIFFDEDGVEHNAYLKTSVRNEIILSAGSLGSPQLLILSGLGPIEQLRTHNISIVQVQPMVGKRMSDNPMNAVYVPSPLPVEVSLIQVVGITRAGTYIEAASGHNFGMVSPAIGQLSTVPPKERTAEAIAKAVEVMKSLHPIAFQGGFLLEKILGPVSTGNLELRTLDPNDNPRVTFNYFEHPEDLARCVAGMRVIERVIESDAFSRFKYGNATAEQLRNMSAALPVNLLPKHNGSSAATLEQYCRDTVMTIWHYHGGCQADRVVDRDYRVLGVDALRVIDGSTFNYSPGTNPQATVMMLGRYMGFKMVTERLLADTGN